MFSNIGRTLRQYADKRKSHDVPDPRAIHTVRTINGVSHHTHEPPMSPTELDARAKRLRPNEWGPAMRGSTAEDMFVQHEPWADVLTWASPSPVHCHLNDIGAVVEDEPVPEAPHDDAGSRHDHFIPSPEKQAAEDLRTLALSTIISLEAPESAESLCASPGCRAPGLYRCDDCDASDLHCRLCTLSAHLTLPFHRPHLWNGEHFAPQGLSALGLILGMNHGTERCPHEQDAPGPQHMAILDTNGLHDIVIGWCRCANAPRHAEQLLRRRIFPATLARPTTGFTFRSLKLFQMLNHVGKLTPWDFCGASHRLTDNVEPGRIKDIYKQFNHVQCQWRIVRAWRRAGVLHMHEARDTGSLPMPCVSCATPGVNIPEDWKDDPDADLIYAAFLGGDANFRISRNNKGGGEVADPSLFGDDAFYAPNEAYKDFSRARGGAPDDQSDITCQGLRAGNAVRVTNSHNKPCTGILSISCIRSGAFFPQGTVDLAKGERFVNFDFALVQVLIGLMSLGLARLVISYDIACKYYIHFLSRIAHEAWPMMTPEQRATLTSIAVVWLVPKFHLAAHIEGCADKFSFNWTKNVGRTCGEMVESNWASLGLLANSVREMGFGHRRDTLNDCMMDWNWRKAVGEANLIAKAFPVARAMFACKRLTLKNLEAVMDPVMLTKLKSESDPADGSQYRPRSIESPTRLAILKAIQDEERDSLSATRLQYGPHHGPRSARLSWSVGINMGLDLELCQQNLRVKIKEHAQPTEAQHEELTQARHKMSKALDSWFANLSDFMPADALHEPLGSEAHPEDELLRLPSDFPTESLARLGLLELAAMERQLHIGQAHDALKKLRSTLGLKSFLVRRKRRISRGQGALTRSESDIDKATRQVQKWKHVYQHAWRALEHLRGGAEIPSSETSWLQLRELDDSHLIVLSQWMEDNQYWRQAGEMKEATATDRGEGRRTLPWIWKVQFDLGKTAQEGVSGSISGWTHEVIRVEWLHAQASMQRFDEEVRLLRAESARVGKTFRYYEKKWRDRTEKWAAEGTTRFWRGACASAQRRAHVFSRLALSAEVRYAEILAG